MGICPKNRECFVLGYSLSLAGQEGVIRVHSSVNFA